MILKAALVALLALAPLVASPALAVVVIDLTEEREVLCRRVHQGDSIVLSFTHSMYGGDVREEYVATADARLRRGAVTTANAAAADYYASTVAVVPEHGRFRVDVPPVSLAEVVVRVDGVGKHRLDVGAEAFDLLRESGDRHRVLLRVEQTTGWGRLLGGAC